MNTDLFVDPTTLSSTNLPMQDTHMHTKYTDGRDSVAEMHATAVDAHLDVIVFSEHVRRSSVDWFHDFAAEVRAMPSDRCRALVGVEARIESFDGSLDLADEIASACDAVVASVHRFPDKGGNRVDFKDVEPETALKWEYELSMAALENPSTMILGHPFGMSLQRYRVVPPDDMVRDVIAQAGRHGKAFELSGVYHPNLWHYVTMCCEAGTRVVLGSDAHSTGEVGLIQRRLKKS